MDGPLSLALNFSHGTEMIIAILVGVGFGFTLERGGFGRSDVLASIFYGRDFRVLRVMFTAIITAMVGLYFFDLLGILPLGSIGIMDTYILPQMVGGLLLGAGFIIGGYCPGTSIVASMSGKIDGMLFVLGLLGGSAVFTLSYSNLAGFHSTTAWGRVLLGEYFGLPSGVMVFAVVLFAVGAFWAAGRIEALVNGRRKV